MNSHRCNFLVYAWNLKIPSGTSRRPEGMRLFYERFQIRLLLQICQEMASSAWNRSAMMSSLSSMPTEILNIAGVMPIFLLSASGILD